MVVAAGPRFLKCYDCVCHSGTMKCVAAGPRFLKCYDSSTTDIASSVVAAGPRFRSEENTSELQSLVRISYAVFCLKKKSRSYTYNTLTHNTYEIHYTLLHQNKDTHL